MISSGVLLPNKVCLADLVLKGIRHKKHDRSVWLSTLIHTLPHFSSVQESER